MLDPIVLGLALSAVAAVVAVIFYLFSGGDNFDKVYNEQAKQLLTAGEKEKTQSKKKSVKRKDVKDKKTDVSDKGSETSSVVEQEAKVEPAEKNVKVAAVEVAAPAEEPKETEGKKKKNKKAKAKASEPAQTEEVAPVEAAKPTPVAVQESSPKKAKKPKAEKKKEEEIDNSDWIPASKKEKVKKEKEQEAKVVEKTTPTPPPSPASEVAQKVEAPKVETVAHVASTPAFAPEVLKTLEEGPLDLQKVLKAFSADPTLTKYAAFIKNFADDKNKQHNLAVEALTKSVEQKRAEFDRSTATLNAQHEQVARKLASEKTELADKVATLLKSHDAARVAADENQRRAETAEKELQNRTLALNAALEKQNNFNNQSTQQTDALKGLEHKVAELQKELAAAGEYKQKVNETTAAYDKVIAEMKAEADAQLQAKEDELQKLQDEKAELNKKTMEQYLEIQALVEKLNAEVPKFEEMKKELDEKSQKFDEQVKKLSQLEAAHSQLKSENDTLRDQVLELTKKLNTSSASTTNDNAGEEIIVLSKTNHLQSAPAAPNQEEVALKEQNAYLNSKNEELRERNFKLLAHLESLEGKEAKGAAKPQENTCAVGERTKAIAVLKHLPEASAFDVPNANDSDAYATWLSDIDKAFKSAHKKDGKKNKDKKSAEPSADAEKYKHALSLLEGELSHIETLMTDKASRYEERIRKLEDQLKSSRGAIAKKKEVTSDHSADELGWEVI